MENKYPIYSIVNYLRRSRRDIDRENRTGEDTLTEQRKLMDKVLENMGIPYEQFFEIGSGDKISSRPVFSNILKKMKEGQYDAIAVKEISRLGRGSMTDMGDIYDTIVGEYSGKGIYIITPHRIYDPSNSSDLRQIRFEMFFAREEFETTRERLVGARHSAAMEGKWMGVVPFGYERNRTTMRLEPIEEEAKIIKMMFQLYVHGLGGRDVRDRAIATYFTKLGIKTPRGKSRWHPSQIKRMLVNKAYIGESKFRTTKTMNDGSVKKRPDEEHICVPDAHEPIINEIVFYEAQEKRRAGSIPRVNLESNIYELTGMVTCGLCDFKMVVNSYTRKNLAGEYKDTYLKCSHGCSAIKYDVVENSVSNLLSYIIELDNNSLYEFYKNSLSSKNSLNVDVSKEVVESIESKKESLKKRLQFIQEKHFEGVYSDEDYLSFKNKIEKELKNTESAIALSGVDDKEDRLDKSNTPKTKRKISNLLKEYDNTKDKQVKNKLLQTIFDKISLTVLKKGSKSKEAQIDLEVTLKKQFWQDSLIEKEIV